MPGKISNIINLITNMGGRYVGFRATHEVMRRTGMLKRKFPTNPPYQQYLTLADWKRTPAKFFFTNRESLDFERRPSQDLKTRFEDYKAGKFLLFNSISANLGADYDWITNPDTQYKYDISKHWTEIPDMSKEAGDIKYVWEKSRFSYLHDIIRYDYHFRQDCASLVFADILSWIKANPVNCGPNYRCSQEMSLRTLNWLFALHYYRNSPLLTDEVFNQMQYALYWHLHHVYNNINFSRIAVRNNHAISETLTLYLGGLFFPTLPGAATWKQKGKQWFEEEIAYQIYNDGTFLQYSMNYHRIVVQLLTWGITLSEKNGERFSGAVYDRAGKSVQFLRTCMIDENGWLPNYGANDGALFFKLSDGHYRDYRPQLQALAAALGMNAGMPTDMEDARWYGLPPVINNGWLPQNGAHTFAKGGYYVVREPHTLTFIKCGTYRDRPQHADGLHLDVWYKGENLLVDAGSYKYNTDDATVRYFSGTASHNTVMLGNHDQMLKGGRFIWYYWTECLLPAVTENKDNFTFSGSILAFKHIKNGIEHKRTVIKHKGLPIWEITDQIINKPDQLPMRQLWHLPPDEVNAITFAATTNTAPLQPEKNEGWRSQLYGFKEKTTEYCFTTDGNNITTTISIAAETIAVN